MNAWWQRDGLQQRLLLPLAPLAWGYAAGEALHRALARPVRLPRPVISVGNLAVGGQGKTPVALEVARRLERRGLRPAILSRGYGGAPRAEVTEVGPDASAGEVGDEPVLLARRGARVFVARRRILAARAALAAGADALVLDDGLQHHALARDLDVVVADASNPLGNGHRLPWGPLREPPSALARLPRRLVWLTRCDLPRDPRTAALVAGSPRVESRFAPTAPGAFAGRRAFLVAGIGRPEAFRATAAEAGVRVVGHRWFPDHHPFGDRELAAIRARARELGAELVLTTEKDAARLPSRASEPPAPFVALPVELRILAGEDALEAALSAALERAP